MPRPTEDTWLVAMVFGSKNLAPLAYNPPGQMGGDTPAFPFAFTNPIYVDADGNGFDKPPFNATRPKVAVEPPPKITPTPVTSPEQIPARWHRAFDH